MAAHSNSGFRFRRSALPHDPIVAFSDSDLEDLIPTAGHRAPAHRPMPYAMPPVAPADGTAPPLPSPSSIPGQVHPELAALRARVDMLESWVALHALSRQVDVSSVHRFHSSLRSVILDVPFDDLLRTGFSCLDMAFIRVLRDLSVQQDALSRTIEAVDSGLARFSSTVGSTVPLESIGSVGAAALYDRVVALEAFDFPRLQARLEALEFRSLSQAQRLRQLETVIASLSSSLEALQERTVSSSAALAGNPSWASLVGPRPASTDTSHASHATASAVDPSLDPTVPWEAVPSCAPTASEGTL